MKTVCKFDICSGCNACVNICGKKAIKIDDGMKNFNAVIDETLCVKCGKCKKVCPIVSTPEVRKPFLWFQGWSKNNEVRSMSSSGGVATEIIRNFIREGGYVCSCAFIDGEFTFFTTNELPKVSLYSGSKYVKSNPQSEYKKINSLLQDGQHVLFVGLPCQVAGMINYCKNNENLFTVDLICHGTPSKKLLSSYLEQHDVDLSSIKSIAFRNKTNYGIQVDGKSLSINGEIDRYLIAYLEGQICTDGCYECKFAKMERCSDITLGDNWASEYIEELSQGVSLILCQTEKGKKLLDKLDIILMNVDLEKAASVNSQLREPASKRDHRESLMYDLLCKKKYDQVFLKYYPRQCIRQLIKSVAIRLHLK